MHCESCWKSGYDRDTMIVDPTRRIFLGPCCTTTLAPPGPPEDPPLTYGIEFSSRTGLTAFTKYGGLSVQYHKPAEEIERWLQGFQTNPSP